MAAVAAGITLAAASPAVAYGAASGVASGESVTLTGTYRRMAKEVVEGGTASHTYADVLVTPGRMYRLRLRDGQRPKAGATVRVSANTTETSGEVAVTGVRTVAAPAYTPSSATLGSTRTLAILAYWTAPDSVTQSRASSQLFGDDSSWLREVSYGQTSLSGSVTPWVRIAAPTSGRCYDYADQIITRARAAAASIGYSYATYDRTLVYFPRCTASDTTNLTGWAFEPGDSIWLNGVMDRRTSVHEHGHSFGIGHGRAYWCTSSGVRVVLSASCTKSEYGDPYDAMGQSGYVAHFSAKHKDELGWLGGTRKRVLTTSSSTFTLPPLERSSTSPLAVIANSPVPNRRYWLEYRQPVGYDAKLPAGATAGVMIHVEDPNIGPGPYLLDPTPADASFATAVLGAGRSWTSPDGVRIAVGTVSATGASVTVTGAKPQPVPPSAPRSVTAVGGDGRAVVSWLPPSSSGNGTISRYVVTASHGISEHLDGSARSMTFDNLVNGVTYWFGVHAVNEAGPGVTASASATTRFSPPTIAITSPADGATLSGRVEMRAAVAPGTGSLAEVAHVEWIVDGRLRDRIGPDDTFTLDTPSLANGTHEITATVFDTNSRSASDSVSVKVLNLYPTVALTAPIQYEHLLGVATLKATAAPAEDGVVIDRVEFYDTYGTRIGSDTEAPYEFAWDLAMVPDGWQRVTARSVDAAGRTSTSPGVQVYVTHTPPSITRLTPAAGATVRGTTLTVTADAETGTPGVPISGVVFYGAVGGQVSDATAPYSATYDISGFSGSTWVGATVYETSNRTGSHTTNFTIDNPLPTVAIASPSSTVRTESVTIAGTAVPVADGAPVEHVTIATNYHEATTVVPAADGSWSVTWDVKGQYATHYLYVTAYDAAGYHTQAHKTFVVTRPTPTVTLNAPRYGTALSQSVPVDLVAGVVPAADATATPTQVCFRRAYSGDPIACGEKQADGTWVARGATLPGGYVYIDIVVTESDGYTRTYGSWGGFSVYGAPPAPYTVHATVSGDLTVNVTWTTTWWDHSTQPLGAYVVRDDLGTEVARTSGYAARFAATRPGVERTYTVEAVNQYGTSALTRSNAVKPLWDTSLTEVVVTPTATTYPATVTVKARAVRADGSPIAGARVVVRLHPVNFNAAPVAVRAPLTAVDGRTTVTFVPSFVADASVDLDAGATYTSAHTADTRLTVSARVEGNLTVARVALGRSTAFNGGVRAPMPGRGVVLQRFYDNAWRTIAVRNQDSLGRVSFPLTMTSRGTYTLRLAYGGDAYRKGGVSPTRTLTVY